MNQSASVLQGDHQKSWLNGHRPKLSMTQTGVERLVDLALESSPVGLVVLGADKSVRLVTKAAAALLGLHRIHQTRPPSAGSFLLHCRALNPEAAGLIKAALEESRTEAQELLLTVQLQQGTRSIAVDVRRAGDLGWVLSLTDVTQTRQTQDWLLEHVSSDQVTGLWNRRHLTLMLQDHLSRRTQSDAPPPACLLLVGLHHFRRVIEALSLGADDMLLRLLGGKLAGLLGEDDMLAYFGDGEFAFVAARAMDAEAAQELCAELLEEICRPMTLEGHVLTLDARIGVALSPADGCTPEDLISNAGLALQVARSSNYPKTCFFEPDLTDRARERRTLEADLTMALGLGEFELHYQPQVNVRTNRVTGLEALIRWRNPQRGLVSPVEFIALAEQNGLIVDIGEWVLNEACKHAMAWPNEVTVAINASPLQFEHGSFAVAVERALAGSRLPAHRLEIEVTESMLLRETAAVLATLAALRELGVRLVLDDFGTGYASLSQLSRFSFDKIKIDQSFINIGNGSPQNGAIVRAIAALGHSLGIPTTAEGVETKLQLEQITADGCTCVQGYLFSRPVPAGDVLQLLNRLQPEPA